MGILSLMWNIKKDRDDAKDVWVVHRETGSAAGSLVGRAVHLISHQSLLGRRSGYMMY